MMPYCSTYTGPLRSDATAPTSSETPYSSNDAGPHNLSSRELRVESAAQERRHAPLYELAESIDVGGHVREIRPVEPPLGPAR